jgi:hypothetical protein
MKAPDPGARTLPGLAQTSVQYRILHYRIPGLLDCAPEERTGDLLLVIRDKGGAYADIFDFNAREFRELLPDGHDAVLTRHSADLQFFIFHCLLRYVYVMLPDGVKGLHRTRSIFFTAEAFPWCRAQK